jgi:hypothetical protein
MLIFPFKRVLFMFSFENTGKKIAGMDLLVWGRKAPR